MMTPPALAISGDLAAPHSLIDRFAALLAAPMGPNVSRSEDPLLRRAIDLVVEAEQLLADQRTRIAELERLSTTDDLTGLSNRRGFLVQAKREIASCTRHGRVAVLCMIDLDGFKQVNDRYGHAAGDAMLQVAAGYLRDSVRDTDIVGRLGGDELAVMLSDCEARGGMLRTHTLRAGLERTVLEIDGRDIPVRASLGATIVMAGDTIEAALQRADEALYVDKNDRKRARVAAQRAHTAV